MEGLAHFLIHLVLLFSPALLSPAPPQRPQRSALINPYPIHYYAPIPYTAVAELRNLGTSENEVTGRIMFMQHSGGPVYMMGNITGLAPGKHGFHIHELGDIGDGCNSVGHHYNPSLIQHGGPADPYRHVGDLGNIEANADGMATVEDSDFLVSLTGPYSVLGRALVISSEKDDFGRGGDKESITTGNSGKPVACGIIGWASPRIFKVNVTEP